MDRERQRPAVRRSRYAVPSVPHPPASRSPRSVVGSLRSPPPSLGSLGPEAVRRGRMTSRRPKVRGWERSDPRRGDK